MRSLFFESNMVGLLETILLIVIAGSILFYIACAVSTWHFFRQPRALSSLVGEPVSILIPVCGLDAGAWENWTSFCQQEYCDYEVLFGVVDPEDLAVPMLQQIASTFGDRVRLFIGLPPRGINLKDSTLTYLLEAARFDTIIFADSDIRVKPDYIRTVTAPLAQEQTGVVTCVYLGYHPRSLGAALASLGRCFDFIPSLLLGQLLDGGLRYAVGVTIATRRLTLKDYGGLHLNRIGSDYNLGKRAARAGYRVELCQEVLESDTGHEGLLQLLRRELRWARTIRFNRGFQYYTMIFCYGTVYCLPLLWVSGAASWAIALTVVTLAARCLQTLVCVASMHCPGLLPWFWTLPLRDSLSFVIWVLGAFGSQVYWRGRRLQIIEDGILKECN